MKMTNKIDDLPVELDTKNRQRYEYNPEQAGIHALPIKPSYLKATKFSTLL